MLRRPFARTRARARAIRLHLERLELRRLLTAVVGVTPAADSHVAGISTDIVAEFDVQLDAATVSPSSLVFHPSQSGSREMVLGVDETTVTINPLADLHPGELVEVTATASIEDRSSSAITPHVWRFRAGVSASPGQLSDSGQSLGDHYSSFVALGDLDGDGDLDAFVTNLGSGNRVWTNEAGVLTDSGQMLGDHLSYGVALGDLDGDGDLDAFVANRYANHVWLNEGAAVFSNAGQALGDHDSNRVALGDVDGDGDLDAFVANYGNLPGEPNRLWLNSGGLFTDSGQAFGDHQSFEPALGDVDGDGDLDAVVANVNQGNRVWLNDDGVFLDSGQSLGNDVTFGIALGDLDLDGDLDAFFGNSGYQGETVWLNEAGVFSDSGQVLGDSFTQGVALGDIDGDGDLDGFSVTGGNYYNHLWINDGGNFTENGQTLFEGAPSLGTALGDLNGDGTLDAFIANFGQPNSIWLNGQPLPTVTLNVDPSSISEDGGMATVSLELSRPAADPVTVSLAYSGTAERDVDYSGAMEEVEIAAGSSTGSFTVTAIQDSVGEGNESLIVEIAAVANADELGDQRLAITIEDDGDPRLAVVSTNPSPNNNDADPSQDIVITFDNEIAAATMNVGNIVFHAANRGQLNGSLFELSDDARTVTVDSVPNLLPGELMQVSVTGRLQSTAGHAAMKRVWQFRAAVDAGSGFFDDSGQVFGFDRSSDVGLGDFDLDGDLDAFVANVGEGHRILVNEGGVLLDSGQSLAETLSIGVALGDLDGDGDLDAFVANYFDGNRVWRNDGGTFVDTDQRLGNHYSIRPALGDLDGDGDLDAIVTNYGQPNRIWLNAEGTFSDSGQLLGDHFSYGIELGDLDNDGDLDAFVTNVDEPNRVWRNDAGVFVDSGQALGSENSFGVALGDLDADGDLDAVVANFGQPNRIWLNDGGSFTDSGQTLGANGSANVKLGDLDGDGDLDAYVVNTGQSNRSWLNTGGVFEENGQSLGNHRSAGVALGDLDGDGDLDAVVANYGERNKIWFNRAREVADTLQVTQLTATSSGFQVEFTDPLALAQINLYDTETAGLGAADVVLEGETEGVIVGSLVIDETSSTVTFIKSGAPLEPDTYTVMLRSGPDGFADVDGDQLDGDGDGVAGDAYAATFVVGDRASGTRLVTISDFVRGPGQPVNLPADSSTGIPIEISDGDEVRGISFELRFDSELLNLTSAEPGALLPGGAEAELTVLSPGLVRVEVTSPANLPAGSLSIANLIAEVPAEDAAAIYGRQNAISIINLVVTDADDNRLASLGDEAVHLVAFFGDVSGNRRINASDAAQVARYAALLDNGFSGALRTDPLLVGDISGNGRVNAADASRVARFAALLDVPEIPPLPGTLAISGSLSPPSRLSDLLDHPAHRNGHKSGSAEFELRGSNTAGVRPNVRILQVEEAVWSQDIDFALHDLHMAIDELFGRPLESA